MRRSRRLAALVVAAAVALGAGGCVSETCGLEGSLDEFYDLSCDFTRVRLYDSELSVEYVRDNGEVPVRVTVRRQHTEPPEADAFNLAGPAKVNLAKYGNVTGSHQGYPIPVFVSGTLELDEFSTKNNTAVSGTFDVTFESGQTEVSLSGGFDSRLVVVVDD